MFYSQFILAKKGPLGTIWIAAHLERKLRKNQVADTDIGVSVDSILFPEVPIALRLSSHLLLGVVRIYSRKVNYLFHDCSEALLKVKQAFRSTAVDLPPEESTAPYHSITLPETFDLDDFELPDSEHFQGNYVDHHVSTREQITLQDTMDGVVYSTSQFGLDERFGDGDTSQISLDLDEELFLDKATSPGQTSFLLDSQNVNPQASGPMTPFTEMDIDDDQTTVDEDRIGEVICTGSKGAKTVSTQDENIADDPSPLNGSEIQTSNINEHNFTIEPVGVASRSPTTETTQCAPCTGHVNEDPSCGFVKNSCGEVLQEDPKSVGRENPGNLYNKDINQAVDCALLNSKSCETDLLDKANEEILLDRQGKEKGDSSAVLAMNPTQFDVVHTVSSPTSVLAEQPKPTSPVLGLLDATVAIPDITERTEVWQNGVICSEKPSSSNDTHAEDLAPIDVTMDTSPTLTLVGSCDKPSQSNDIPTPSEGITQSRCVSPEETSGPEALASDLPERCNPSDLFPPGADSLLGLVSTHEPNGVESGAELGTKVTEIQHNVGSNKGSFEHQHVLRACSSVLKQSEVVVSNGPEISFTGTKACSLSILELEEDVHASGVSALVQGEEGPTSIRETNIEPNKILESVPSNGVASNVEKLGEQSDTVVSKDSQSDRVASFNLPVPEPEMLLSVPASVPDAQNDLLVQFTPEKEVSEEGGNGLKNPSGRKRQLMESAPVQQYGSSTKLSGIPRSKRTVDSIPDDDDLLSSILVGRKSSVLKLRPTPPPTEIAARKRPRITPRASVVKRKVLLDDTMVLHGDTIRQQLTSTEDIRRLRKKAPCTRPEIWVIQKHLLEDEIFNEPLFTGMSVDLIGLQNRIFDVTEFRDSGMNVDRPVSEVPGEVMWSSGTSLIGEANTEGPYKPVAAGGGEANESTATIVMVDSQLCEEHLSDCIDFGTQQLTRPLTDISPNDLQKGQADISSPMEIDNGSVVANTMNHTDNTVSEDRCNQTLCSEIKSLLVEKSNGVQSILPNDGNLDTQSVEKDAFIIQRCNYRDDAVNGAEVNMEGLHLDEGVPMENDRSAQEISESGSVKVMLQDVPQEVDACDVCLSPKNTMLEKCSGDNRADVPEDASASPTFVTDCHFKEGIRSESEYVTRDENVVDVAGNSSSTFMCFEDPQRERDFSCQSEFNITTETVPFDEFENEGSREADLAGNPSRLSADLGGTVAAETTSLYNASLETPCDLGNTLDGNDTGFLNFDDEDTIEEDNGIPNAEEVGILDNSGWSSRTRGVAKYLQTLFDTESGHGRKVLSMDNLLSGKTRKEASRMFFETLVLKTRDYIHVEQENAFDIISIKPRVKLVKSDF